MEQSATARAESFEVLVGAQAGKALSTDDVIVLALPLFQQVAALHAEGKVAALAGSDIVVNGEGALALRQPDGHTPAFDIAAVHAVQPQPASNLNIVGTLERTHNEDGVQKVRDLSVQTDLAAPIVRPVYLPGPASWEKAIGHHDDITDVFLLGMLLASLACGLDFDDHDELSSFAANRHNLFALNDKLHPIVAQVIVEMTEVNRHDRATDVASLATRLRTWREQPTGLDVERVLNTASGVAPRRAAVLRHLRDRLFDLSRRNRLLYFRPTAATVNLTVASVPLMLQVERIRADQICTWGGGFAEDVTAGKSMVLQNWLRFDDQPYLPSSLDQLLAETRRDRAEYGFSNLRLVVAFLRWHNLKEAPDERVLTPLLWLPVELSKRKGVKDQYVIHVSGRRGGIQPCAAPSPEPVVRHRPARDGRSLQDAGRRHPCRYPGANPPLRTRSRIAPGRESHPAPDQAKSPATHAAIPAPPPRSRGQDAQQRLAAALQLCTRRLPAAGPRPVRTLGASQRTAAAL
jgi:hypothetical protein